MTCLVCHVGKLHEVYELDSNVDQNALDPVKTWASGKRHELHVENRSSPLFSFHWT